MPACRRPGVYVPRTTHDCDAAVLVRRHLPGFLARLEEEGHPLPEFVRDELAGFGVCGDFRLWLSSIAYLILHDLRRLALAGTQLARAQVSTIRCRLLKIGALVTVSVRRIYISLSSVFPLQDLFPRILANIRSSFAPA